MLSTDSRVAAVYYPGLPTHPQHAIAKQLFRAYGGLLSFELKEGFDCFDYLNRLKIAIPASNLGDTRTLVIPVAHTIYHEMGQARRASMGIAESLIRVSVGIEDTDDFGEGCFPFIVGHLAGASGGMTTATILQHQRPNIGL
jgi:O-acetylhomoserine (thiol)-lyase